MLPLRKLRRSLAPKYYPQMSAPGYLLHGGGDFIQRLHDILYESRRKLGYFGRFCALELYGTIKPAECPPMNGRMAKALRYLGFEVKGT